MCATVMFTNYSPYFKEAKEVKFVGEILDEKWDLSHM